MNRQKILSKKIGLASLIMLGGVAFTAGNANAGFFDKLNEALDSVTDGLDKANKSVDNTQAKLDETKAKGQAVVDELDDAKQGLTDLADN